MGQLQELDTSEVIECATYTHARRHPMVLGKIGGWSPPFQLTIAQLVVLIVSLTAMLWSWRLWAVGPGTFNLFLAMAVPTGLTWAVRHMRIEGRDPLRWLLGIATYLSHPRTGIRHGRPARDPRVVVLRGLSVPVTAGPSRRRGGD